MTLYFDRKLKREHNDLTVLAGSPIHLDTLKIALAAKHTTWKKA